MDERTTRVLLEKNALSSMVNSTNSKQLKEPDEKKIRGMVKDIYDLIKPSH